MKILHLSNVAGKLGGGISEVVHAFLYYQIKFGYDSILWFLGKKSQINEISNKNNLDKKSLYAITQLFGLRFLISPTIFFKLRTLKKDIDILHQHGIFMPISWISLLLNKRLKVIISPHGFLEPEKLKVSSFKKKMALLLYERKNLNECDCLVACSHQEAISLRDFGFSQPIVILPNGVHNSMIKKNESVSNDFTFKLKYGINKESKILLFLSRVHPFKGLKLLLESIVIIKEEFRKNDWIFVIAGTDELNHTNELKIFVHKHNIGDIVRFIGPQYNNDKIIAFDSANCFILPSIGENFGIAVLEALARGLPVITTKNTPWSELQDNSCGWSVERNKNEFIRIILKLFSFDDNHLIKMGKNGINLVKDNYTWPRIAEQTICMYNWVLNDYNKKYKKGFTLLDDNSI